MKPETLLRELKKNRLTTFIEVPCSYFSSLISCLAKDKKCRVINPVNEAIAIGIASGSYIATKQIPVLLMQNSGVCNVLNCLTSLNQIYSIPVLLLISWRGQPRTKDAPEHDIMGKKMKKLLDVFDVPYAVLSQNNYKSQIANMLSKAKQTRKPTALIIKKDLVEKKHNNIVPKSAFSLSMADAVDFLINTAYNRACFITTNGFISREALYIANKRKLTGLANIFYMLGSMGHAHALGLGIADNIKKNKKVIVLDGDGGCLMHLGSMTCIDTVKSEQLIHVVLDNGTYASTGGQITVSANLDLPKIAHGCGYKNIYTIKNMQQLKKTFPDVIKKSGPSFLHIFVNQKVQKRPRISEQYTCIQIKEKFNI